MIYSVIMSAALILLAAMTVLRLIYVSGIPDNGNRCRCLRSCDRKGFGVSRNELMRVFLLALAFRAVIFLIAIAAMSIVTDAEKLTFTQIIESYKKWDVSHYIQIATQGYGSKIEDGGYLLLVFFPLYPVLLGGGQPNSKKSDNIGSFGFVAFVCRSLYGSDGVDCRGLQRKNG